MCDTTDRQLGVSRDMSRRGLFGVAAGALAGAGAIATGRSARAHLLSKAAAITQPSNPGPKAFMARAEAMKALAIKNGDQGFGAVIVKNNRIVGQAPSRVVTNRDPTAHAEVEAIRDAARRLGARDLSGCVMYGTFRACPMCETAAYWASITQLYYGSTIADGGRPRYGVCK